MRVAELMYRETVSFRERYGWSQSAYLEQLKDDMARAGLNARLQVFDQIQQ